MVFAGVLPWTFFSTGLSEASNSLINNTSLISKVYFPRLIMPIASMVVAFVDLLIGFGILLSLMFGTSSCRIGESLSCRCSFS